MKAKLTHGTDEQEIDNLLSLVFLTVEETSKLLRLSVRQTRYLIYKGVLPAVRLSYRTVRINKNDVVNMMQTLEPNKQWAASIFAKPKKAKTETATLPKDETLSERKGNERKAIAEAHAAQKQATPQATSKSKRRLLPSSNYKQSVRDTFTDAEYTDSQLYTMAEICSKYGYTYGRFYNLRMRYEIPCIKANSTKCFPKTNVDAAMKAEAERLGKEQSEYWYSCFDIMRIYGLGKTQVRRFAETHHVRIKKCGKDNRYLKADWDAARKEAEKKSTCTKSKRE